MTSFKDRPCPYDQLGEVCKHDECLTTCTLQYPVNGRGGKGRKEVKEYQPELIGAKESYKLLQDGGVNQVKESCYYEEKNNLNSCAWLTRELHSKCGNPKKCSGKKPEGEYHVENDKLQVLEQPKLDKICHDPVNGAHAQCDKCKLPEKGAMDNCPPGQKAKIQKSVKPKKEKQGVCARCGDPATCSIKLNRHTEPYCDVCAYILSGFIANSFSVPFEKVIGHHYTSSGICSGCGSHVYPGAPENGPENYTTYDGRIFHNDACKAKYIEAHSTMTPKERASVSIERYGREALESRGLRADEPVKRSKRPKVKVEVHSYVFKKPGQQTLYIFLSEA